MKSAATITLQKFTELVRAIGAAKHQKLLDVSEIKSELQPDDQLELERSDVWDRQAWAELLAHRLARQSSPFHTSPTRKPTP